ncbi:hypothetical protein ACN267_20095 [Micromonospora sp. WMMD734]|uniref:hypothetical protein n=1 Tax=Micromonospora sp. WMMD734 TaxID=3404129 RepID=UPI003B94E1E0
MCAATRSPTVAVASATSPVSGAGNLGKPIRIAYIWQVWDGRLHPEVEAWFLDLCRVDPASADLVGEAIDLLAEHGPALGRPLVDRLKADRSIT